MEDLMVFIGAGNMAEALVRGVVESGLRPRENVMLTDVRPERLAEMGERYGVKTCEDNAEAVENAAVIFLCVKPQQMEEVLMPLRGEAPEALWVSIAAGVPTGRIEEALGGKARVVRVMPNTPALVGCGAAAVTAGASATSADVELARTLMESVGECVVLEDEEEMHAVTALSGSGPAYVFYLVEAMLRGAAELGLDPERARDLAVQTVAGAAELLSVSGEAPEELRRRVTSKGGTTEAAITAFEGRRVSVGLVEGMLAAETRSRELAERE